MPEATIPTKTDTGEGGSAIIEVDGAASGGVLTPEGTPGKEGILAPEKGTNGAPEKYEPFKAPEGVTLDTALVGQFTPLMKEAGLSQEAAQKFVDAYGKHVETFTERGKALQLEMDTEKGKEWEAALSKDAFIGGSDHAAKVGVIKRAVKEYLDKQGEDKELIEFYSHPAYASHPGIARLVYYLAKRGNEATSAGTHGTASTGPKSTADVLYGGTPKAS